jgi:hypothetical protein
MDDAVYRFYPDLRDCRVKGTAYWLVPNKKFHDVAPMPSSSDPDIFSDLARLDPLSHAAWRVKLRGNLSSIGRHGFQGKYWRELDVSYVMDATQLDCKDVNAGSSR